MAGRSMSILSRMLAQRTALIGRERERGEIVSGDGSVRR
jgi:hypothetical protein